jgi:hypothetical protein
MKVKQPFLLHHDQSPTSNQNDASNNLSVTSPYLKTRTLALCFLKQLTVIRRKMDSTNMELGI